MKRAVLIGDTVFRDALPLIEAELKEEMALWSPDAAVNSTASLLEGLREWALKRQPDIVFLACGMADTRRLCFGEGERLAPLEHFGRNVRCALRILLERSTAAPIWATITPVDRRTLAGKDREQSEFGYDNDAISLYNEEAKAVAAELGVETLDLYGFVKAASRADSRRPDGIRFDERATRFLAERIVEKLRVVAESAPPNP